MIVDSHCHILPPDFGARHDELAARDATYSALFPEPGGRFADADQLLRDMDAAGVDHAVAMGFGWTDPDVAAEANDYLLQAAGAHPDADNCLRVRQSGVGCIGGPRGVTVLGRRRVWHR